MLFFTHFQTEHFVIGFLLKFIALTLRNGSLWWKVEWAHLFYPQGLLKSTSVAIKRRWPLIICVQIIVLRHKGITVGLSAFIIYLLFILYVTGTNLTLMRKEWNQASRRVTFRLARYSTCALFSLLTPSFKSSFKHQMVHQTLQRSIKAEMVDK